MIDYKVFFLPICMITSLIFKLDVFSYLDEFMAVIATLYIAKNFHKLSKTEIHILVTLLLIICTGFIGTYLHRYQSHVWPILLDILGCTKFFLVFIMGRHYTLKLTDKRKIGTIKAVNALLIPFVFIAFLFGVINCFVDIGMSYEIRMGFRTYKFIFSDSAHIGMCWYLVLLFLTANYMLKPGARNLSIIIMALIVWLLTFKSRAVLFILLYILLFIWLIIKNKPPKVNVLSIAFLLFFSIFLTVDQLDRYFLEGNERMPRTILLAGGIDTMRRFFPFGAGFGTYGTDVAAKFYSELYYELGYNNMWGLSPDEPIYAHDNYWPAIMGEFGIVGIILEGLIFYFIYKTIRQDYKINKYALFYGLYTFITQLFASVPTSVFFQSGTIFLFFILPLLTINPRKKQVRI